MKADKSWKETIPPGGTKVIDLTRVSIQPVLNQESSNEVGKHEEGTVITERASPKHVSVPIPWKMP